MKFFVLILPFLIDQIQISPLHFKYLNSLEWGGGNCGWWWVDGACARHLHKEFCASAGALCKFSPLFATIWFSNPSFIELSPASGPDFPFDNSAKLASRNRFSFPSISIFIIPFDIFDLLRAHNIVSCLSISICVFPFAFST